MPDLYSTDAAEDPTVVCKFFLPGTVLTWYAIEAGSFSGNADAPAPFYGYRVGSEDEEVGYFDLDALEFITVKSSGVRCVVERDLHWIPVPLSKVKSGEVRGTLAT